MTPSSTGTLNRSHCCLAHQLVRSLPGDFETPQGAETATMNTAKGAYDERMYLTLEVRVVTLIELLQRGVLGHLLVVTLVKHTITFVRYCDVDDGQL